MSYRGQSRFHPNWRGSNNRFHETREMSNNKDAQENDQGHPEDPSRIEALSSLNNRLFETVRKTKEEKLTSEKRVGEVETELSLKNKEIEVLKKSLQESESRPCVKSRKIETIDIAFPSCPVCGEIGEIPGEHITFGPKKQEFLVNCGNDDCPSVTYIFYVSFPNLVPLFDV